MSSKNEVFGQFLIRNQVITEKQLDEALKIQKDTGLSFGELCMAKEALTETQVKKILRQQWQQHKHFGEIAIELKLLTQEQVDQLLKIQELFHSPLGRVLTNQNILTQTELEPWLQQFKDECNSDKDVLDALKNVDLFSGLSTNELAKISFALDIKTYENEEIIYKEGDPSHYLYLIQSGTVEITMQSGDDRLDVNVLIDWNNFGLYSLLNRKPHVEQAKAIGQVNVWRLSWEDLHEFLYEYPSLSVMALKHLSGNIEDIVFSFCDEEEISDLYMTALVYSEQLNDIKDNISSIINGIAEKTSGKTLLLSCAEESQTNYSKQDVLNQLPKSMNDDIQLECLALPKNIKVDDLKEVIRSVQKSQNRFSSVIILLSTHSIDLVLNILEFTQKSAFILDGYFPKIEDAINPQNDRIYFVQESPDCIANIDDLAIKSNIIVPSMYYLDDINRTNSGIIRWLLGRTIGLAFGGGGARTMVNAGILEVFDENDITFDLVSGTSGGALFGALYAIGLTAAEIKESVSKSIAFGKDSPANDYSLTLKTIIKGKKYKKLLRRVFGDKSSCSTRIPLYSIATDINNGKEVIVNRCQLWESVYVSSAIPGYSPLININGKLLGEGGLVNNVPSTVLKKSGAD
ncbi:MAG: cyclic nucleotide-binding domain-containing protein, partial [Methylococcales bacterium]|nr:cyclic nucleotide-binding domain-containing protein [Methylococcales bacterium]